MEEKQVDAGVGKTRAKSKNKRDSVIFLVAALATVLVCGFAMGVQWVSATPLPVPDGADHSLSVRLAETRKGRGSAPRR